MEKGKGAETTENAKGLSKRRNFAQAKTPGTTRQHNSKRVETQVTETLSASHVRIRPTARGLRPPARAHGKRGTDEPTKEDPNVCWAQR